MKETEVQAEALSGAPQSTPFEENSSPAPAADYTDRYCSKEEISMVQSVFRYFLAKKVVKPARETVIPMRRLSSTPAVDSTSRRQSLELEMKETGDGCFKIGFEMNLTNIVFESSHIPYPFLASTNFFNL